MSAVFQTFQPGLIVDPGKHTRKSEKYDEHGRAHHHGIERHRNPPLLPAPFSRANQLSLMRIKSSRWPHAAARASARAWSSMQMPPWTISITPSRSNLVKVRLTVSIVSPR